MGRNVLSAVLLLTMVAGAAEAQTTHDVSLSGFLFTPADITIEVGDTVHWQWVSGTHNVESGVVVSGVGVFDGNFRSGDPTSVVGTTFDVTFDQAFLDAHPMPNNIYPYYCVVHAAVNMVGSITVTVPEPIPAASSWGLIVLALLLAMAGTFVVLRRSRSTGWTGSVVAVAVVFLIAGLANADPIRIKLEEVASGMTSPVALTHAGDGSGRLFVVDQIGKIWIIDGGTLLPVPFLDISAELPTLSGFYDERGLLGLAFHPDYANNGRFFVQHSVPRTGGPDDPCSDPNNFIAGCHAEVLAEYSVSGDPNVADPASETVLFSVDEPEFNHNAGAVAFGPDGMLYFGLGDGGGANDDLDLPTLPHGPIGNGQNIDTWLGSMLRIDVDSPPAPGLAYAIPADNPFVGSTGLDEIFAYGFRNPYTFSFDDGPGGDGALYVADVGQDAYEEIDDVVKGGNYGWAIREGTHCFDPFNPGTPPASCATTGTMLADPLIDPVCDYSHPDGGLAVVSGFVYRGAEWPNLVGKYVFGDFSRDFGPTGSLYYFDLTGPDAFVRKEFVLTPFGVPFGQYLKGLGEDENGEIYVLASDNLAPTGTTGVVYRLTAPATGACCTVRDGCQILTQEECDLDGGTYNGDGATCDAANCPPPVPATSQWGLLCLALSGLCAGSIAFGRKGAVLS